MKEIFLQLLQLHRYWSNFTSEFAKRVQWLVRQSNCARIWAYQDLHSNQILSSIPGHVKTILDVGSGSVTPIITKTGENIQTLTTGTFPLSEDKVPVRMGNETVMVPKKSIGSVIQTDKESDLSDININYSDMTN